MHWKKHQSCCVRYALERDARMCPECGSTLLRCRQYDECHQLLAPGDHCPVHVAPQLQLLGGSPVKAIVGGRLSLPFLVKNASGCQSDLKVRRILKQDRDGEIVELPPDWDRIGPGEDRRLFVDTGEFRRAGRSRLKLYLVLGCQLGSLEESYAFSADIPIKVKDREQQSIHVEQAGGDVIVMGGRRGGWTETTDLSTALAFERAEAFELRQGLRGYPDPGYRIQRNVRFEFPGFPEGDVPPPGQVFLDSEKLRCGRNSRTYADSNDVALRAYGADGEMDWEVTSQISGVHLELLLWDDRLCLRGLGRNGTFRNGEQVHGTVALGHGDRVRVLGPDLSGPEFEVGMIVYGGRVEKVIFSRTDLTGGR